MVPNAWSKVGIFVPGRHGLRLNTTSPSFAAENEHNALPSTAKPGLEETHCPFSWFCGSAALEGYMATVDQQTDFYKKLRSQIDKWAESKHAKRYRWAKYILIAPDLFHLLTRLSIDPEVPVQHKAKVVAALAYFIMPFDLLPELLVGPIGFVDDIALASYVINGIVNNVDPEIVRRHWAGKSDILILVKEVLATADKMIGKGLWHKVRQVLSR